MSSFNMKNNYKIKDFQKSQPNVSASNKSFPNKSFNYQRVKREAGKPRDKLGARKEAVANLNELFKSVPVKQSPKKEALLKTPSKIKVAYMSKVEELKSEKRIKTIASTDSDTSSSSSSSSSGSVANTSKIEKTKNEKGNDNVACIYSKTPSSSSDSKSDSDWETESGLGPIGGVAIENSEHIQPANTQATPSTKETSETLEQMLLKEIQQTLQQEPIVAKSKDQSITEDIFEVQDQTVDNVPKWFPDMIKSILRDPRCPADLGFIQLNTLTSFRLHLEVIRRHKWKRYIRAGKACSQLEAAVCKLEKRPKARAFNQYRVAQFELWQKNARRALRKLERVDKGVKMLEKVVDLAMGFERGFNGGN